MKPSKKKFLKLPEYPGGKEAFQAYIKLNIKYPEEALKRGIQGIVYLSAEINDNGDVHDIAIENGIGFGCDQEAIRLIENIRFGRVKNRGVRVKTRKKFKIEFKLPSENKIDYLFVRKNEKINDTKTKQNYSYTIQINYKNE